MCLAAVRIALRPPLFELEPTWARVTARTIMSFNLLGVSSCAIRRVFSASLHSLAHTGAPSSDASSKGRIDYPWQAIRIHLPQALISPTLVASWAVKPLRRCTMHLSMSTAEIPALQASHDTLYNSRDVFLGIVSGAFRDV